jgi:glucose/mannose transport system permease protein
MTEALTAATASVPARTTVAKRPNFFFRHMASKIALTPLMLTVLVVFIGCTIWTVAYSLTKARVLPSTDYVRDFIGIFNYTKIFADNRWNISIRNLAIFGVFAITFTFVIGFLLAVLMDQKIRFENTFRTIFLYPFALSAVITGLVWQWYLNPAFGLQKAVRSLGWESFTFDWIANRRMVLFAIGIAAIWQGTGLVMALMLAGLRSVDNEIWSATRIDGIPKWRVYLSIVIPMMRPVFVTAFVLVAAGTVRTYDIVVAMTAGGPGLQSQLPTLYIIEYTFSSNLGQGLAAATMLLVMVAIIIIPWAYYEFGKRRV